MIRGYVKIVNQTTYTELPEPLEWEIVRADKADRDSFYYIFPFDPALRQTLSSAVAFQLKDGTTLLFSGRVDGYTVNLSAAGGLLKLYGRSTAALLMDYEFPAADYVKPTMKLIAQTYVGPVSVACYYDEPTTVPDSFHVSLGDSAMKVISNFAASVEALPCYIRADGAMRITFTRTASGVTLGPGDIVSAKLLDRRRGVVSEFRLIEDDGYEPRINSAFVLEGGRARRYLKECVYSEKQIIYETMRNRRLFKLLLTGTARLEPASTFTLNLPQFSFNDTLYVTHCRSFCTPEGQLCEITASQY